VTGKCVVGVDVGTSSTKGCLVAFDGEVLATEVRHHSVHRGQVGHVEMDAEQWWAEYCSIVQSLVAVAKSRRITIASLGVSGMGPCVALATDEGVPTRPAILYGVDTRASEQVTRLHSELGIDEIVARGGSVLTSQAAGPKLAWVREHEPDVYAKSRRFFMPASWLAWNLTGEYALDHQSASQCWPLYDIELRQWHRPWAEMVCPGIDLPRLAWASDIAGYVTQAASLAIGVPAGTPVIVGSIDAWMEAISVGAHRVGDLLLMYGSTMFLVATTSHPVRHPTLWSTSGALPDTWSLGGGMATSGAITDWIRGLWGDEAAPDFGALVGEAADSGVGARGLLMLPYFAGERTPLLDPEARGVIAGLTLTHTRGDLYRAALEATAFGVRHNLDQLALAGASPERIVVAGGGTQGGLWTQIVSDITGIEQVVPSVTVGACFGAALLAAQAIDSEVSIDTWNPPATVVTPSVAVREFYDERYLRYRDLYTQTTDIAHYLADEQRAQEPAQC